MNIAQRVILSVWVVGSFLAAFFMTPKGFTPIPEFNEMLSLAIITIPWFVILVAVLHFVLWRTPRHRE